MKNPGFLNNEKPTINISPVNNKMNTVSKSGSRYGTAQYLSHLYVKLNSEFLPHKTISFI